MHRCYDEAVDLGLKVYRKLEYSLSCLSAFQVASREFKEYMESVGLPYSPQLARQWVNTSKEH